VDKEFKRDPIGHYSHLIRLDPQNYRAVNNRGNEYEKRGHHDLAIADYNHALEMRPDFTIVYINRGNAYQKVGEYEKALEDYNKAIQLNPHSDMAYNNRGFHLILMGKLDAAEHDIRIALEISPNNIYALNSMAELYAAKNDAEKACQWLHEAIEKGYNNWNYIKSSKTYNNIRLSECFKKMIEDK
jgi:Flp pilus assembly protein TadD